ncbi:MAG: Crp/Fnr family transcriptional regulator [Hydrogenophaga sp.]|nr:Crp/Fnr family transcriptional regulator [Hydrogenophaga sp.]
MEATRELERFEPFAGMSTEGRSKLRKGTQVKSARVGDMLLHKGQSTSGAYLVLNGRLRVFTLTPKGTEATLYFIEPGETCVLALNCLFNDLRYPAWVRAEADTSVAVVPGPLYRRLFESEPTVQGVTVHALATLVFRLMAELEQVHSSHHRQRLAQFLLLQVGHDGSLRMTQMQLAQHLGTTREVVARLMQEYVALGLVRTRRGGLTVLDWPGLRRLAQPTSSPPTPGRRRHE